jgi:dTDP-4-dehydrorhamnose reductase
MLGTELMETFHPACNIRGMDLPELDITQRGQCYAVVGEFRPDVVINAAGLTRVDYCEDHEEEAYRVNGEGVGNLAKAAAGSGCLFVHYGTDYIFDGRKRWPYLEEDLPNPINIYGKSKLLGEDLVRQHCPDHLILRTSWLFGSHGGNFIQTIVNAAKRGSPLRVVNDQKGSPSYAKDVASHTLKMIQAGCRRTYHLTNSGFCTWHALAQHALEWAGITGAQVTEVPTSAFPRPAARPANSVLANARLVRDGLPLLRSWEDAAREYVALYLRPAAAMQIQIL